MALLISPFCLALLLGSAGVQLKSWASPGMRGDEAPADSSEAGARFEGAPPAEGAGAGRGAAVDLPTQSELDEMIARLADLHSLDLDLVRALISAESAFDVNALSPAGAVGLMQVMPSTGADYGVASTEALFDPSTNLDVGMRHLRDLLDAYPSLGQAIMAYNAGEGALRESQGYVRYPETQRYTHAVLSAYLRSKGVGPYSARATELVGFPLTPAMARAGRGPGGSLGPATAPPRETVTRLSSRLAPDLSRAPKAARSPSGARISSRLDRKSGPPRSSRGDL